MVKKIISLDIGSDSIKMIYGYRKGVNFIVEKSDSIHMPNDAYVDGKIINRDAVMHVIQEMILHNDIKTKNMVMTINNTNVVVREFVVPAIKSKELDTMIRYEIIQTLPIELDQYIFENIIVGETIEENIKKNRILVTAVPKNTAESLFLMIKDMNFHPYGLMINPLSIFNLVDAGGTAINEHKLSKDSFAIIDMGHHAIDINIFNDFKLTFTRRLSSGMGSLDSLISISKMISLDEARRLREKVSVYSDTDIRLEISKWISDIQRAITFNEGRTNKTVKKVYICGGGSQMHDMSRFIGESLGIDTEVIRTLSNIKCVGCSENVIPLFMSAIGSIPSKK